MESRIHGSYSTIISSKTHLNRALFAKVYDNTAMPNILFFYYKLKIGRIDSSGRRPLHLRITPSFLEQEDLILLRCSVDGRSEEKLTLCRRNVSTRVIASPLKTKSGWALILCTLEIRSSLVFNMLKLTSQASAHASILSRSAWTSMWGLLGSSSFAIDDFVVMSS